MNHYVPDFHEMEDDYSIPTSSGFSRPRKSQTGEEDIMELMWQNGQVVVQRSSKKHNPFVHGGEALIPAEQPVAREIRPSGEEQHQLFMQEDEMASWLQYPIDDSAFDRDLYSDLLYSAPPPQTPIAAVAPPRNLVEIRPPPAPPRPPFPPQPAPPKHQSFGHFSRFPAKQRTEITEKPSVTTGLEATVVESNETPVVKLESRVSQAMADRIAPVNTESVTAAGTGTSAGELGTGTCELTVTSSPGGSRDSFSASAEMFPASQKAAPPAAADDRKRKAREADDNDCRSEDVEFGGAEVKKQSRGAASTKRSRAAEVHNLSERRRRDRINEKMRALQELIPRCNKSDKASMLDEAIEYLKSLQLQVQMMSMGCGMVPMMYPGMQQYMPAMGMGMGMGMDMGMNRPMVPYPTMLPGSSIPNPSTATHMGPRFPMPAFHMPSVPVTDPSRVQAFNQNDPMLNSLSAQNSNQHRMPNFVDPYQQFLGQFQGQVPIQQSCSLMLSGLQPVKTLATLQINKQVDYFQ